MKLSTYLPTKNGRLWIRINVHSFLHEKMREATGLVCGITLVLLVTAGYWYLLD